MFKKVFKLWVGIALATGATGILMASDPLKIGMELAYPPFEMSDKDGKPAGVSVDLAHALGKYLNREVVIKNIAWTGLIPSLKTKKIDLIISSMGINKKREKVVAFSIPYANSSLAILTFKDSGITNIKDLDKKGKKVAVKQGTVGHTYVAKHLKNATILPFDKENAAVLEVIQKKADGFLYDQLTIYKNWSKHKDTTTPLLKRFQEEPDYWGMALRKDDKKLKTQVDAFIKKAKSDGTFDKMADKYLKDAKETFKKLDIPFFF